MKNRIIKTILTVCMLLLVVGVRAEAANGNCGSGVTWTLNGSTLTISGSGAMSDYSSSNKAPWFSYISQITSVNVGSGVTHIGDYAFWTCSSLGSVSLASTVKSVGSHSFDGCTNMYSINLNYLTSIGSYAFRDCSSLGTPAFGSSLSTLGEYAFNACASIESVNITGSNLAIGQYAFYQCNTLSSVTLGSGVTEIGYAAFSENDLITSVSFGSGLKTIGDFAFYHDDGIKKITIPNNVTSIGNSAFKNCVGMTSLSFGNGITDTGVQAFNGCTSLASITFGSNVRTISSGSFGSCKGLTEVTLPDSVTTIAVNGFYYCKNLTKITLGSSVSNIEDSAFYRVSATVYYPSSCSSVANQDYGGELTWVSIGGGTVVTPKQDVTISSQPSSVSVKEGASVSFSVTASGGTLSYQWQQNVGNGWYGYYGTGYNSSTITLTPSVSMSGYKYRCVISNTDGNSAVSNEATLTVTSSLAITSNPSAQTVNENNNATFKVAASGNNLTYQWQEYNGSSWSNIWYTGYNTATLTVAGTLARNGYQYRCIVYSGSSSVTSSAAKLTVRSSLAFTTQPQSQTVTEGKNAKFTVAATGTDVTYQWQVSTDSGSTWKNSGLTGAATASLTVAGTIDRNGYRFRCVATDAGNNTVTSNAVSLSVNATMSVTTQPSNQTANEGSYAYFTTAASGSGLTYQWYTSADGSTWKVSGLSGNKTAKLKVQATSARNGYKFRCLITDVNGNTRVTNAAVLTVTGGSIPVISSQPAAKYVVAGSTAKFTVTASGSSLTYQWQASADGGKTWKNSSFTGNKTKTLSVSATAARSGYQFRCVVSSSGGKAISSAAALTVFGIKTQPANKSVSAGTTAKFSVTATGSGLTYQWQASTDGGKNWNKSGLTGNKTRTLSVRATAARSGYQFRCVITDSKGNKLISKAVTLTVK